MADDTELNPLDSWLADDSAGADATSPADPPSPDASAEAQGAADDVGPERDELGRFVARAIADDSEAREEDAGTATGDTGQAPADASAPTPDIADASAEAEPEGAPFAVRYGGQVFDVPGARLTEKGLFVPREHVELVETFLGKGVKLEHERVELKRAKAQAEMAAVEAQIGAREFESLMKIAQIEDEQQFAEAMLAYGLELRAAIPTLQREREVSRKEAELRLREEMGRPDADEQVQQVEHAIAVTFDGYVSQVRQVPELSGMTDGDWQAVQSWMQQNRRSLIVTAGRHLTPEEQAAGVRPGETYFARDPVDAFIRHTVALRKEATDNAEKARKAIEEARKVADSNARKMAAAQPSPQRPKSPQKAPAKPATPVEEDFDPDKAREEYAAMLGL